MRQSRYERALPAVALVLCACAADGLYGGGGPQGPPAPPAPPVAAATVEAQIYGDGYGGFGGFLFAPGSVSVFVNGTVTWENPTGVDHNVTFGNETNALATSDTYQRSFPEAGTFTYHCAIHPQMSGAVQVVLPP
jgi:plastocyanin